MSDEMIRTLKSKLHSAEDALQLGVDARAAQAAYFKTRSRDDLIASKDAEKRFDTAARFVLSMKEPRS
jgi:hypothetical protein